MKHNRPSLFFCFHMFVGNVNQTTEQDRAGKKKANSLRGILTWSAVIVVSNVVMKVSKLCS